MSDNTQTNNTPVVPGIAVDTAAPTAQDSVAQAASTAIKNGAVAVGPAPAQPPAGATVIQNFPKAMLDNEFFAKQAEALGYHAEAAQLRGKTGKPSIWDSVKRVGQHRITVSDVVVYVGGAGLLVAIYEGLAYYFEWDVPRIFSERPTAAASKSRK